MLKKIMMALIIALPLGMASVATQANSEEGEVVIRNDGDKTIYEYKINGKVKEIKVVPKIGEPYYLVPDDVDESDLHKTQESKIKAPWWVIFRW